MDEQTKPLSTSNEYNDMDRRLVPEYERQKGTKLIEEENYNDAIKAFSKAIMAFEFLVKDNQLKKQEIRDMLKDTVIPCYSNITLCYVKKQEYENVVTFASRVIENDKSNTKAFYRRGVAYKKLKKYELSIQDLQKAKKLDSSMSDAINNILREITALQKNQKIKEKKIAQKLLQGFGEAITQEQQQKAIIKQETTFIGKIKSSFKTCWQEIRKKLCPRRETKQE